MRSVTSRCTLCESLEGRQLLAGTPFANADGFNAMTYDGSGNLHVAYYDRSADTIVYSKRSSTYSWADTTLGSATLSGAGNWCSIAVDSTGKPAVAYIDAATSDLKVARYSGTAWSTTTIESTGSALYPSIAFDGSNNMNVSYFYRANSSATGELKHAIYTSGSWSKVSIDTSGNTGRYSSIAKNPSTGRVAISYEDTDAASVAYTERSSGGTWSTPVTVQSSLGTLSTYTSLAFDTSNRPAIAYYDAANADVRYASRSSGGTWSHGVAYSNQGIYPQLSFNPDTGTAYITAYGGSAVRLIKGSPGSWSNSTLQSSVSQSTSAAMSSLQSISFGYVSSGSTSLNVGEYHGTQIANVSKTQYNEVSDWRWMIDAAQAGGNTVHASRRLKVVMTASQTSPGTDTTLIQAGARDYYSSNGVYEIDDGTPQYTLTTQPQTFVSKITLNSSYPSPNPPVEKYYFTVWLKQPLHSASYHPAQASVNLKLYQMD